MHRIVIAALSVALLACADLRGQAVESPAGGGIQLNFRDAPVDAVLSYLSEVAGLVIIRDAEIAGRITVISRQPLSVDEAVAVLNSVLREKGYAAIRVGRTMKIINFNDAKRSNIPVRVGTDPSTIAESDEVITQVMPIRFVDATRLREDLSRMISEQADVSANANSNTLIVTDTAANIRRLAQIITALDTATASVSDIRVFALQYANATNAARLINEIFREGAAGRGGRSDAFQRYVQFRSGGSDSRQAAQQAAAGRPDVQVSAAADDRTNTIVVSGPPETLEVVATVIAELDANPTAMQTVITYHVKNGNAKKMETVLSNLFGTSTATGRRDQRTTAGAGGGISRDRGDRTAPEPSGPGSTGTRSPTGGTTGGPPGSTAPGGFDPRAAFADLIRRGVSQEAAESAGDLVGQVYVTADEDTNSLLIMTSPKYVEQVLAIIEQLDRPVPQVLIKVLIAEVTHTNALDLGTEFSILNVPSGSTLGTNFGLAAAAVTPPAGLVYSLITDEITATIRALEETGRLEVLSRPYILASDNQPATITVGSEVPFIRNTRITETGQTINTIQYDDVGIILTVTPHINPDGVVVMDVSPEISAISGETVPISETVNAPVIAKRSARTRVAIRDGQTIVIGGLVEDQKTDTVHKVPLLGDIPLLGLLFQRQQKEKRKTELLIFLTPHVAQHPGALGPMTEDEKAGMRIVPEAVEKGSYEHHMEGMQRGRPDRGVEGEGQPVDPQTPPTQEP